MKTNNSTTSTMDVLQQFILAEKGSPSPPSSGHYGDETPNPIHGSINNNLDRKGLDRRASWDGKTGLEKSLNETGRKLGKGSTRSNESLSKRDARFEKNLDKRRRSDGKAGEGKVHKTFFLKSILSNGKKKSAKEAEKHGTRDIENEDPKRFFASNRKPINGTKELNNKAHVSNASELLKSSADSKPINQNGQKVNDTRFDATSLKENNGLVMDNGKLIDNNKYNGEKKYNETSNNNKQNRYDQFEKKSDDGGGGGRVIGKSSTLGVGAGSRQNAFISREKEFAAKSATLGGRDLGRISFGDQKPLDESDLGRSSVGDQKPPLSPNKRQEGTRRRSRSPVKKVKAYCSACKKKCSGEVLRVQEKYFHIACFQCTVCKSSLAQGGYFNKDGAYYCTGDYQKKFGTRCAQCGDYVEGEVVTALGNTYHQKCFTCARCRQVFPSGDRVTYQGKEFFCTQCVQIPLSRETVHTAAPISPTSNGSGHLNQLNLSSNEHCTGCSGELGDGQALIALDKPWHVNCFKCKSCSAVLHGEYMGKDGVPYCEKDYQKEFGVKCAYCNRFIYGKVLQAGDNHHFHPTCAKCSKCGDLFGDGEEMYVQGGAIWHPKCGPGPQGEHLKNGDSSGHLNGMLSDDGGREFDRLSSSAASELQFAFRSRTPSFGSISNHNTLSRKYPPYSARAGSPGLLLREYSHSGAITPASHKSYPDEIMAMYTYSYLTEEPTKGYLRRPVDPYDKPPTSPHFHRPHSSHSHRASSRASHKSMSGSRSGMKVLVESYRGSETPRPKSPHMNNEEPITLAHFPAAKPPHNNEVAKIERDDFPAPPYPYSDPERRRRWSDSYKGVPVSDDEDEVDNAKSNDKGEPIKKLKKEEEELSKIASGIGKVFLRNVKEREKLQKWKQSHLDPRNASRTPSATKEPVYRLRYQSPVNASPSRNLDAPRPWEEEEFDRTSSYRSSVGRSTGAIHSYNVVSSLRNVPKPGYTMAPHRSHTFSSAGATSQTVGDYSLGGLGDKTHSTNFSSGKSDVSNGSIYDLHPHPVGPGELPVSSTYAGSLGYAASYSNHIQRSLPNMSGPLSLEPPKIYPYHLLIISNYRLPPDVDRKNLERHLSDVEFETLFLCTRSEFYRMPQWRRNDLKKRARLF